MAVTMCSSLFSSIEMIHNRPAIEKNALYFVNKTKLTCLPENKMQTGSIYERDIHENCHPTVNLPPQKSLDLRLIPSVRKKAFEVSVNARARSLEMGGKGRHTGLKIEMGGRADTISMCVNFGDDTKLFYFSSKKTPRGIPMVLGRKIKSPEIFTQLCYGSGHDILQV